MTSDLKSRVMRKVYWMWFWKRIAPPLVVEAVLLVGVAAGVLSQISLPAIFANAMHASSGVWSFLSFFASNFFVKSMQSRLLVAAYGAIAGFFIRDLASGLRRMQNERSQELGAMFALLHAGRKTADSN